MVGMLIKQSINVAESRVMGAMDCDVKWFGWKLGKSGERSHEWD